MNKQNEQDSSIERKLLNSTAIRSLQIETDVYDVLSKLKWSVEHSPYYKDTVTNKYREIDVTARKYWKKEEWSFEVNILVECKSLSNWHIVASNKMKHGYNDEYVSWIGEYSYQKYDRFRELIEKLQVNEATIEKILHMVEKACYPDFLRVFNPMAVEIFEIPSYNAFRETDTKNDKSLNESVVWKAFLSLSSCIQAYKELLFVNLEYILINGRNDPLSEKQTLEEHIIDNLMREVNRINYIHPVLVLESNLWEVIGKKLKPLKFFRLIFKKKFEDAWWIDVVNSKHIEEYFKLSKEYDSHFKRKGFKHVQL